jgi:hypothetical protein
MFFSFIEIKIIEFLDMKNTKIISFRGISITITIKIEFVNNKRFDIKRM